MMRRTAMLINLMLASFAGSVSGREPKSDETQLMTEDENYWLDQQSPALKNKILADLKNAKICIADYSKKNGIKDATIAFKSSKPRFYIGGSYGVVFHMVVPGVKDCRPTSDVANDVQIFKRLPEAIYRVTLMTLQWKCADAATQYAAAFNRTLAKMKPELLLSACPAGELKAK